MLWQAEYNAQGMYWLFEFDYALRFVRKGGRKATMPGPCAHQIPVASSSRPKEPPSRRGPRTAWD